MAAAAASRIWLLPLLALLALLARSSAVPSIAYTDVSLGAYFWPSEPLLVTITAQKFDLLITNQLSGTLSVTLNDVFLAAVPAGATTYFEPSNAQGWVALNASFVLLDPDTNATLGQTSLTFTSPPAWVANLTVSGSAAQMVVTNAGIPPPLYCVFSDPMGTSSFSALEPNGNQQTPGPQLFICPVTYFPDVIPVGTLFVFGVVLLPQNIPVSGPAVTFKTGAVWTQVTSVATVCSGAQLEVSVGGFWNVSEEYTLSWQLHGSAATVTGPYARPKSEAALVLRTGTMQAAKGSVQLLGVVPRSTPYFPVPYSGVQVPYAVAGAAPCKNPNHGAAIALICLGVFLVLVIAFAAFFWYYKRFIGHDLLEHVSLLRGNSAGEQK